MGGTFGGSWSNGHDLDHKTYLLYPFVMCLLKSILGENLIIIHYARNVLKHFPPHLHHQKINIEAKNDGFPKKGISSSRGSFSGSMLNFRGVILDLHVRCLETVQKILSQIVVFHGGLPW